MNILYGVPGEGMGHATRSKVVISHLLKKHQVRVVSSSRAYQFLAKAFPGQVLEIGGFHLAYKNARVSRTRTVYTILKDGPKNLFRNFSKYISVCRDFKPDLVISDFESFAFIYALHHRLPVISIDNMQIINRCRLDIPIPRSEKENYLIAKHIIRAKVPGCRRYLVTTFFKPPVRKKRTLLIPPIIRDEILKAKTAAGNHILVYQTSQSQPDLVRILQKLPQERFRVYGFNRSGKHGNVTLRPFSEKGFIRDLAGAKAVITNGGFSLISECVYLIKPVCAIPIHNQFEQYVNAAYIQQLGYGRHFSSISDDNLKAFLYELDSFRKNIKAYKQDGNQVLYRTLDRVLKQK
jgi:uncharacterized protein (TIGR00661 family)